MKYKYLDQDKLYFFNVQLFYSVKTQSKATKNHMTNRQFLKIQ